MRPGVISEALTPMISTSPFPGPGVMEGDPPGAETLQGKRASDPEFYNKECFGTQWWIL